MLLEWAKGHPTQAGPYFYTTLWGKVLHVTMYPPSEPKDPRVYWYGPIDINRAELWSAEMPQAGGYYYRGAIDARGFRFDYGLEYLDYMNGRLCKFDEHSQMPIILTPDHCGPNQLWHGPIPRPPIECIVTGRK